MSITPTPWEFDDIWSLIKGPEGEEVAAIHAGHSERKQAERFTGLANAELIIKAVNSYQAMKEALEAIVARIDGVYDNPSLIKQGLLSERMSIDVLCYAKQALTHTNGKDKEP